MIDRTSRLDKMLKSYGDTSANGVPNRLLNGLLEPPKVEGIKQFPAQPIGANPAKRQGNAPLFNKPIQVADPAKPPSKKKTKSVLKRK